MNNIELIKKIEELEQLEKAADKAQQEYEAEPENVEKERAFDSAYKKEFSAYISAAKELERLSGGKINFCTAKKLIQTRRSELIELLKALQVFTCIDIIAYIPKKCKAIFIAFFVLS